MRTVMTDPRHGTLTHRETWHPWIVPDGEGWEPAGKATRPVSLQATARVRFRQYARPVLIEEARALIAGRLIGWFLPDDPLGDGVWLQERPFESWESAGLAAIEIRRGVVALTVPPQYRPRWMPETVALDLSDINGRLPSMPTAGAWEKIPGLLAIPTAHPEKVFAGRGVGIERARAIAEHGDFAPEAVAEFLANLEAIR